MSIASAGNDHRLGGSEAPPTIISVYLGETLEKMVEQILSEKESDPEVLRKIDLGLAHLPHHEIDSSDRNRTSFFAFTGNKFEFRAVGASAHPAFPITVINAIVADSLALILDEISDAIGTEKNPSPEMLLGRALAVLRKHLKRSQAVLFNGNGYSAEWEKEAEQRGLPNIKRSFHAFAKILEKKAERAFEGILTPAELHSRYEVLVERYVKTMNIEVNLMIELFRTQTPPAALLDQKNRAESIGALEAIALEPDSQQVDSLQELSSLIGEAIGAVNELEKVQKQNFDLGWEAKGKVFCEILAPKMAEARSLIDRIEKKSEDALWPLPKYRELLYLV